MGQNYDGSWAEYVVVPFGVLVALPEHIPFEQAALIADAVATPYTGLVHRGRLGLGETVGLWGIGGLGVHAVQTARLAGAALIIAVDPIDAACQRRLRTARHFRPRAPRGFRPARSFPLGLPRGATGRRRSRRGPLTHEGGQPGAHCRPAVAGPKLI